MLKKYTVKEGDTLWSIAKQHHVSFQELKKANPAVMNRYPKEDRRYGWVFEKEEINIPNQLFQNDEEVKETCKSCCQKKAKSRLTVMVHYTPYNAPVEGATVTIEDSMMKEGKTDIEGSMMKEGKTDIEGRVEFIDLLPGTYIVTATYDQKDALVEQARSPVGKTTWAYDVERLPYPSGSNKCNLFVYEMLTDVGYSVPMRTYKRCWGYRTEKKTCIGVEEDRSYALTRECHCDSKKSFVLMLV